MDEKQKIQGSREEGGGRRRRKEREREELRSRKEE